jgi:hypothetical protein
MDNDRVLAGCTNVMYYIVAPALKIKSRYEIAMLLRLHNWADSTRDHWTSIPQSLLFYKRLLGFPLQ